MTTAEALAVVREALAELSQGTGWSADDALAALALIEERLREVEAERDEFALEGALLKIRDRSAEQRVAEFEAALREGGCQFYIDGDIGACQKHEEADPCLSCRALGGEK